MVSYIEKTPIGDTMLLVDGVCLSTDTKPTGGISNGSHMIEMDTGLEYYFDETGNSGAGEWLQFPPATDAGADG